MQPKRMGCCKMDATTTGPCCSCYTCDCECHKEKEGFMGRVQLSFYRYPDNNHEVKITFNRYDDLPDPNIDKRDFTVMGLLAAQVQDTAKGQLKVIDTLITSKKEIQIIMGAHDKGGT